MFWKGRINLVLLILTTLVYISEGNEKYLRRNPYGEYFPEFVVQLPVYENAETSYSQNMPLSDGISSQYPNYIESSTHSSFVNKIYDEIQINDDNGQQYKYIEIETPQPEVITTSLSTSTEAEETSSRTLLNFENEQLDQYTDSSTDTDSRNIGEKNKSKNKINKELEHSPLEAQESKDFIDIYKLALPTFPIDSTTKYDKNSRVQESEIEKNTNIPKQLKSNRNRKRDNRQKRKQKMFNGFGQTFKTLQNFLSMEKLFTDILEPVEEKFEVQNKSSIRGKPNLYSLIAKATSLKKDTFKDKLNKNKQKYNVKIGKLITKRSSMDDKKISNQRKVLNTLKVPPEIPDPDKEIETERNVNVEVAKKNFKLTMKMLANVDTFVSSMLKSYIERLSSYIDHEELN